MEKIIVKVKWITVLLFVIVFQYVFPLLKLLNVIQFPWEAVLLWAGILSTVELIISIVAVKELLEDCKHTDLS